MIDPITVGVTVSTVMVGWAIGYFGKKTEIQTETVEKVVYQQKCFYCGFDIVGAQELDLINHSLCISRTPEELLVW